MCLSESYNVIDAFNESIKQNWDSVAISETKGSNVSYSELAGKIEYYHLFWKNAGLNKGDKIAIVSNNSAGWIEVFMSIMTGGYIAVLLQPNMLGTDIISLLNHSDSRMVYAEKRVIEEIDESQLPNVEAIFDISQNNLVSSTDRIRDSIKLSSVQYEQCYPVGITSDRVFYEKRTLSDVCTIIYTSGTTGEPKGAMISVGYWSINVIKLYKRNQHVKGDCEICISPFYHIVGLGADLLTSLCSGLKLVIISDFSFQSIFDTIRSSAPRKVFAPPIILCKFVELTLAKRFGAQNLNDFLNSSHNSESNCERIREEIMSLLGGNIESFTAGGTPVDKTMESFLLNRLHFPLLTAYGLTECGLNSMGIIGKQKELSSGTLFEEDYIRIDSVNPNTLSGEIQFRGCIFSGYYKNPEATKASFTDDGWFKTGDLGHIDNDRNLFITGRCKEMLLTSNSENIYPKEIEETMNASPFIKESILVQRGEKLYAIVVPDREKAEVDGLDAEGLNKKIDEAVREASKKLPGFTIISGFELRDEPLERTPKGSLKRYLYS